MRTLKDAVSAGDIVRDHFPIRMNDHLNLRVPDGRRLSGQRDGTQWRVREER
jgi:hypothetical protein